MLIVGEKINVISKELGAAMKERNPEPILAMARKQVEAGADLLDINIGQVSDTAGAELMEWLVTTIQGAMDVRLCLDTANPVAIEAGLKVHKGRALINSATAAPDRMHSMLGLAGKYGAECIGLTLREKGLPRDADERTEIAFEILGAAAEHGVSPEDLYLDPLIFPVAVAQDQAMESINSIQIFKNLSDPPCKTIVGLSNISNNTPPETKPYLDRVYLIMLAEAGLDAAIMDPLDEELAETAKSLPEHLPNRLSELQTETVLARAVKIFHNEMLYAHSFME